ncbi:hypothetical protein N2152v2_003046 [Parachlorella kessleri]
MDVAEGAKEEAPKVKVVYRLLKRSDVKKALVGEEVFVLWPDNCTWYRAEVEDLSVKNMTADLFYAETEEQETANLAELIQEGQIAFQEERPADHECSTDEIELGEKYTGRQAQEGATKSTATKNGKKATAIKEAGAKGEEAGDEDEEVDEEDDAGAAADSSDPSFSSGEEASEGRGGGRGRTRRGLSESEDESAEDEDEPELEDFEKRELLKDMSDDEKPLWDRKAAEDRRQKRLASKAAKQSAAAGKAGEAGTTTNRRGGAPGSGRPAQASPRHRSAAVVTTTATPAGASSPGGGAARSVIVKAEAASAGDGLAVAAAPGERPRRRASAGVAAATQALAAAAGVVIEPAAPRAARTEAEEDEEEAERYAQSLLAKVAPAPQKSLDRGHFYGGRLEKRSSGAGAAHSEADVRDKARERLKQALELAAKEAAPPAPKKAAVKDAPKEGVPPAPEAAAEAEQSGAGAVGAEAGQSSAPAGDAGDAVAAGASEAGEGPAPAAREAKEPAAQQVESVAAGAVSDAGGADPGGEEGQHGGGSSSVEAKGEPGVDQAEGAAAGLPDPGQVAAAVEDALFKFAGAVNKEYKAKLQSLWFNLKDPQNPDLRGRVLRGELPPDRLVRLSAVELASRELAEYRKQKEQESLKMSVLDAEAAARFSTAAALDARDRLAMPAQLVADKMLSAREEGRGGRHSRSPSPLPAGAFGASAAAPAVPAASGELARVTEEGQPGAGPSGVYTVSEAGHGTGGTLSPRATAAQGAQLAAQATAAGAAAVGTKAEDEAYDPEKGLEDEDLLHGQGDPVPGDLAPPPPPPGSPPRGPSAGAIDWASIKAKALQESVTAPRQDSLPILEPLGSLIPAGSAPLLEPGSAGREARKRTRGGAEAPSPRHHHHHHQQPQSHSRSPGTTPGAPAGETNKEREHRPESPPGDQPHSPGSLAHLFQPPADPGALGRGVWEGQFGIPGAGAFLLAADALAGSGDVAGMLGEQEIELKGRVPLGKLESFLVDLRHSRSRTVTLGLLRGAADATPDERTILDDVVSQYASRQRTGFGEAREYAGAGGAPERIEIYIVPAGTELVGRVLRAARGASAGAEAAAAVEAAVPGGGTEIGEGQLLLLLIHKRDWRDWFDPGALQRPVKRPRVHPPPHLSRGGPPPSLPSLPIPAAATGPPLDPRDPRTSQQSGGSGVVPPPPPPGQPAPQPQPGISLPPSLAPPTSSGPTASNPALGLPNIDWQALSALSATLGALPGTAGAPAGSSAPPGGLPDLSRFMQHPSSGFCAPPGGPGVGQPPPQQQAQQGPPAGLPFDSAQLELLLKAQQQAQQQPAQQGAGGGNGDSRKRKSRWEEGAHGEGGGPSQGPHGGGNAETAGGGAAPGPMRREMPAAPQPGASYPPAGPAAPLVGGPAPWQQPQQAQQPPPGMAGPQPAYPGAPPPPPHAAGTLPPHYGHPHAAPHQQHFPPGSAPLMAPPPGAIIIVPGPHDPPGMLPFGLPPGMGQGGHHHPGGPPGAPIMLAPHQQQQQQHGPPGGRPQHHQQPQYRPGQGDRGHPAHGRRGGRGGRGGGYQGGRGRGPPGGRGGYEGNRG